MMMEFRDQGSPLARMEREGRYTPPAQSPASWPRRPEKSRYTNTQVEALLNEMRGDH